MKEDISYFMYRKKEEEEEEINIPVEWNIVGFLADSEFSMRGNGVSRGGLLHPLLYPGRDPPPPATLTASPTTCR